MKTVIAALAVLVAVLEVTVGQLLPVDQRLANQEQQEQVVFNRTYIFGAAHQSGLRQLDITDAEVKAVCANAINGASPFARHPRTCCGYVNCVVRKKNPFMQNTVYYIQAYVQASPEQTFFNPDVDTSVFWSTANTCALDPCKTNRPMTDGRGCNTYVVCQRNNTSSAAIGYQTMECPDGESFDVVDARCKSDSTCKRPTGERYTNIRCVQWVPAVLIPGLPPKAYYNRTYINHDKNDIEETVQTFCPSGLIFNTANPDACECVTEVKPNVTCPSTVFRYYSEGTVNTWKSIQQEGNAVVELANGTYQGWVRFGGGHFDYFSAKTLANNELTGPWTIKFSFAYDGSSSGDVALLTNSLNSEACPVATIRVILGMSTSTIRAEVTNVDGFTISVQSNTIPNLANRSVTVQLTRDGFNRLQLSLDGNVPVISSANLGTVRVKSTACGLLLAHGWGLTNFQGWMNDYSLIKNC